MGVLKHVSTGTSWESARTGILPCKTYTTDVALIAALLIAGDYSIHTQIVCGFVCMIVLFYYCGWTKVANIATVAPPYADPALGSYDTHTIHLRHASTAIMSYLCTRQVKRIIFKHTPARPYPMSHKAILYCDHHRLRCVELLLVFCTKNLEYTGGIVLFSRIPSSQHS
jgi:hypothetical protein